MSKQSTHELTDDEKLTSAVHAVIELSSNALTVEDIANVLLVSPEVVIRVLSAAEIATLKRRPK